MAKKARLGAKAQQALRNKGTFKVEGETKVISPAVIGQLEPLDRVAREKTAKWGDSLPGLVPPDLAGRFRAAYDALDDAVMADDVVGSHKIATQLMRAWDVLEKTAMDAGHRPPVGAGYAVDVDGVIVAFTQGADVGILRRERPDWIVYHFEDAARLLRHQANEIHDAAMRSFPDARVVAVRPKSALEEVLDDEIPF